MSQEKQRHWFYEIPGDIYRPVVPIALCLASVLALALAGAWVLVFPFICAAYTWEDIFGKTHLEVDAPLYWTVPGMVVWLLSILWFIGGLMRISEAERKRP